MEGPQRSWAWFRRWRTSRVTRQSLESLFGLSGRTVLVVGASSGLGAEAASALASAGANVGLVARRRDRLAAIADDLRSGGVRAHATVADVTDRASMQHAIEEVEQELGNIWGLVYAAGVAPLGRAERHRREDWDRVVAVNQTGAFEVAQLVGARMIERSRGGRIVLVSSVAGVGGSPVHRFVGYSASKGAVNQLVRHLAVEWAQHAITVNAVAPAYFPTEMTIDRSGTVPDAMRARIEQFTPMGRLGNSGETQTAFCFLMAPASSYVTGAIVPVDGGWSAW